MKLTFGKAASPRAVNQILKVDPEDAIAKILQSLDVQTSIEEYFPKDREPIVLTDLPDSVDQGVVYCQKTGKPLGARYENDMEKMWEYFHKRGISQETLTIKFFGSTAVCPMWQDTSKDSLKELQTIDPYGYFVFAASWACIQNAPGYVKFSAKNFRSSVEFTQFQIERILAWQQIQDVPIARIIYLNDLWQKFLACCDTKYIPIFPFRIDQITQPQLVEKLEHVIVAAISNFNESRLNYALAHTRPKKWTGNDILAKYKGLAMFQTSDPKKVADATAATFNLMAKLSLTGLGNMTEAEYKRSILQAQLFTRRAKAETIDREEWNGYQLHGETKEISKKGWSPIKSKGNK